MRGEIEENLKFDGQLMVKLYKSKTIYQIEKGAEIRGWYWIRQGQNCIKSKVWSQLGVKLKEIKSWRIKLNFRKQTLI